MTKKKIIVIEMKTMYDEIIEYSLKEFIDVLTWHQRNGTKLCIDEWDIKTIPYDGRVF
jgi:hypothetical protein